MNEHSTDTQRQLSNHHNHDYSLPIKFILTLLQNNPLRTQPLILPGPKPHPIKHSPMPDQAILPIRNPMRLIGEMQEPTRDAERLQHVEVLQALGDGHAVVAVVVRDEVRGAEVSRVRQRVPLLVLVAVGPDGAVVVALDEPDLVGAVRADLVDLAGVRDERLEALAELVGLDPVCPGKG